MGAEYQSVMSIGLNKVMNGNCKPPARPSLPVSLALCTGLSTLRPISNTECFPSRLAATSCTGLTRSRHEWILLPPMPVATQSILNRLIGFSSGTRAGASVIINGFARESSELVPYNSNRRKKFANDLQTI